MSTQGEGKQWVGAEHEASMRGRMSHDVTVPRGRPRVPAGEGTAGQAGATVKPSRGSWVVRKWGAKHGSPECPPGLRPHLSLNKTLQASR